MDIDYAYFNSNIKDLEEMKRFASEKKNTRSYLKEKHIKNCKIIKNRIKFLECLPKNGVCAEVGILHGHFSNEILSRTNPKELYLFDINKDHITNAKRRFSNSFG